MAKNPLFNGEAPTSRLESTGHGMSPNAHDYGSGLNARMESFRYSDIEKIEQLTGERHFPTTLGIDSKTAFVTVAT